MKRLLLLRHAQALSSEDGDDISRAISPKGLNDALALGSTLKRLEIVPDHIFCSSAARTQQTCEKVLEGLEQSVHTEISKALYSASADELFHIIKSADERMNTIMLVAHNPSIYELAVTLAAHGSDNTLNHLVQGYAPATLSIIESDVESWSELDPEGCRITSLLDPLDYNGSERPTRWT